jgi:hypothetical protein
MLRLDYKTVKDNVFANVIPYIEHLDEKEIAMHLMVLDLTLSTTNMYAWASSTLTVAGVSILTNVIHLNPAVGYTAIGLGLLNIGICLRERHVLKRLMKTLSTWLKVLGYNRTEIEKLVSEITDEELIEFMKNSAYYL